MVEELETEIAAYESETGRQQTQASGTVSESFSGYTASLITAVTKLMSYLKEVFQRRMPPPPPLSWCCSSMLLHIDDVSTDF